ncbi:MAG: three-Cys-motif partner protein TcmP [Betaproteobacteria bacterium]
MAELASPEDESERAHSFGSLHTIAKLETLGKYLAAYTTALKSRFRLHYLDAFAGAGVCHVKVGDQRLMVPGSASIAIGCEPKFHRMVFIEKSKRRAEALERLKERESGRDIEIIRGDANFALPRYVAQLDRRADRAITFLDPYGMQVAWSTLRDLAASEIVDVWYLFPLSALYRQATRSAAGIDADKAAALTRIFGADEWRTAFYSEAKQTDLFGPAPDERTADVPQMEEWVKKRLETILPAVLDPVILHLTLPSGKRGAPLFAFFFAIANPSPRAKALALRIAKGVLDSR